METPKANKAKEPLPACPRCRTTNLIRRDKTGTEYTCPYCRIRIEVAPR